MKTKESVSNIGGKRRGGRLCALPGWIGAIASIAVAGVATGVFAQTYYDVGTGQPYATIQAALDATFIDVPAGSTFTDDHIIRVHAGTYAPFNTDLSSKLNGKSSRTSANARLIIEAVPGDLVTVNSSSGSSYIRESYVTIQGLRFTGRSGINDYYLTLNYYNEGRGGLLVYNNEFVGASALDLHNGNTEIGAFDYAFVQNNIHSLPNGANTLITPGGGSSGKLVAGNLVYGLGNAGASPLVGMWTSSSMSNAYVINNTYIGGPNNAANMFVRVWGVDQEKLTIANNLIAELDTSGNFDIGYDLSVPWPYTNSITAFPLFAHNLQFDNGNGAHRWARISEDPPGPAGFDVQYGDILRSLTQFTNALATRGVTMEELGSIDNQNPLFEDAAHQNYQLETLSPAWNTGNPLIWSNAVNDLGIESFLSSYFNPILNPGYDFTHAYIGALIPEPSAMLLTVCGWLGLLWIRHKR